MKPKEINYQERIKDYDGQLKGHVRHLNERIDTVLAKHEQDFLNAFKCQMFSLNTQIRDLKKKNEDNEVKLKKDDQINKLRESLEFFQEEAVKLGESSQFFKTEAEKWKAKAESLEDDRKFLENQLKITKRKVKTLQVDAGLEKDFEDSMKSSVFKTSEGSSFKFIPTSKSGEVLLDLLYKHKFNLEGFLAEAEKTLNEIENKFNESIRHLKNSLENERKKNRNLAVCQNSALLVKSDLESLFLDCVDEVKRDANRRKIESFINQKYKRANQTAKENFGLTGVDKKRILELLLSKEQVIVTLYEQLFPNRAAQYSQVHKTEDKEGLEDIEELFKSMPGKSNTQKISKFRGRSAPFY